ncbi:hypothetical protein VP01_192g2 [Puccinia sorghi]|uniref:Uncharacterized protein n=1 Tax=Puccinia sorghi TaxID=27349 RepID=A0A0L6VCD8_9BASI|nr:hypothetical protein VP01_192g2 [Puccinia sorghi]
MASHPEPQPRTLPILNKAHILDDLESLAKDGEHERRLCLKAEKVLEELSSPLEHAEIPQPSEHPEQPTDMSGAVRSAVQLLHLNDQLAQRAHQIEHRKIGDRLELNRRKIDHLLRALNQSTLMASSNHEK